MTRTLLMFVAAVTVVHCSQLPEPGGDDGDSDAGTSGDVVPCVHHTTDAAHLRDTDLLPVGGCVEDAAEPVCTQVIREPCECVNVQVPRKFYSCTCVEDQWACEVTAQDMGVCDPSYPPCVLEDGGIIGGDAGDGDAGG